MDKTMALRRRVPLLTAMPSHLDDVTVNKLPELTLLPTGGGLASTVRLPATALEPRVLKVCHFFFIPFGHIVAKFQKN